MARRLHQTLADYLVIAISPALIMTLVGSLVFFLLEVFYQGEFPERLHWVMACFVFARRADRADLDRGRLRAGRAVRRRRWPSWSASPPTRSWNSKARWIDQLQLAHQLGADRAGLVVRPPADLGLHGDRRLRRTPRARVCCRPPGWNSRPTTSTTAARTRAAGRHHVARGAARLVAALRRAPAPAARAGRVGRLLFAGRAAAVRHRPVVHSRARRRRARRYAFWLLCVYVASGLGLLLTTSFLGLRRYLRQRRIEMPTMMANLWLGIGAA